MARLYTALALGAALVLVSSPALAGPGHHGHHGGATFHGGVPGGFPGGVYYPVMPYQGVYTVNTGAVQQGYPQGAYPYPYPQGGAPDPHWQDMMERCGRGREHADNGVGGAAIGGVVGGVIGNRVADGDRLLGTVAGAAVGAVAGAVIDKSEDRGRDRDLREECDAYFSQYNGGGYGPAHGGGYGYPGYMMVPVMVPGAQKPCVETTTVTEEWVNVPTRNRSIPRRPARHHDKRVKEKRVYTGS